MRETAAPPSSIEAVKLAGEIAKVMALGNMQAPLVQVCPVAQSALETQPPVEGIRSPPQAIDKSEMPESKHRWRSNVFMGNLGGVGGVLRGSCPAARYGDLPCDTSVRQSTEARFAPCRSSRSRSRWAIGPMRLCGSPA